jgi:predicted ABC-type sugar transport system permease subunit
MTETATDRPTQRVPPAAPPPRDLRRVVLNWFRELTLVPVIVLLMIGGAFVNPVFFTSSNLSTSPRAARRSALLSSPSR